MSSQLLPIHVWGNKKVIERVPPLPSTRAVVEDTFDWCIIEGYLFDLRFHKTRDQKRYVICIRCSHCMLQPIILWKHSNFHRFSLENCLGSSVCVRAHLKDLKRYHRLSISDVSRLLVPHPRGIASLLTEARNILRHLTTSYNHVATGCILITTVPCRTCHVCYHGIQYPKPYLREVELGWERVFLRI